MTAIKTFPLLAGAAVVLALGISGIQADSHEEGSHSVHKCSFGTTADGQTVDEYTLTNKNGV